MGLNNLRRFPHAISKWWEDSVPDKLASTSATETTQAFSDKWISWGTPPRSSKWTLWECLPQIRRNAWELICSSLKVDWGTGWEKNFMKDSRRYKKREAYTGSTFPYPCRTNSPRNAEVENDSVRINNCNRCHKCANSKIDLNSANRLNKSCRMESAWECFHKAQESWEWI